MGSICIDNGRAGNRLWNLLGSDEGKRPGFEKPPGAFDLQRYGTRAPLIQFCRQVHEPSARSWARLQFEDTPGFELLIVIDNDVELHVGKSRIELGI